jgi:hypothetical protein
MWNGDQLYSAFPSKINRYVGSARRTHLDWPREFGLVPTAEAERRHLAGDYATLAACFHPAAGEAALRLGGDQASWLFLFDDQFDDDRGADPAWTARIIGLVADCLSADPAEDAPPIVRAFADLWRRSAAAASDPWRERAQAHWREFLSGYVAEAENRRQRSVHTVADYLSLRAGTVGVQLVLDLAEVLGGFEVPVSVFRGDLLTRLRRVVAEVVILDNDIRSLPKEFARADPMNLLILLGEERNCSPLDLIGAAEEMIAARIREYLRLETELVGTFADPGLDVADVAAAARYLQDAVRPVLRGSHDWAKRAERFAASSVIQADLPGYSANLC